MKSNKPLSRKKDLVTQEADGEIMIFDLNINKAFCLNETSSLIWDMCDGKKTTSEISEGLAKKLSSPANEDLVWLALDQLKKNNLIANSEELENKFEGMSRREVIKKVGIGTMIALPMVAGMIAPTAINAASGAALCATGSTVLVAGGPACNAGSNRPSGCQCSSNTNCVAGTTCQANANCTSSPMTSCQ